MFYVTLQSPDSVDGTGYGNPIVFHPDLMLTPTKYSATDRGGFDVAEITATGPALAVQNTLQLLRYGVEIVNGFGSVCWAGFINEVECYFGGMVYRLSLDRVSNSVKVLYSYKDATGTQVSGLTDAANADESIARYGTKEIVIPASDIEQTEAEQLRDTQLAHLKYPLALGEPAEGDVYAVLRCLGWFHALEWRYYSNSLGQEEHTAGSGVQPLGLGFTSTDVGFTQGRTVQDMAGRFRYFPAEQKIVVSGSTSNNGTFTLESDASVPEPLSLTSATVRFEPDDDIIDTSGQLGFIKKGSIIEVSGTTSNDGFHVVDSEGASHVTTYTGFGGTITNESAGSSFTIDQGNYVDVAESMTNEDPGDTVTVICYGQKIAQSFQLSSVSGWTAARIGIEVARTGTPADDLTINLCADSSGSPGSTLATGTIDVSDVTTSLSWQWAEFSASYTLSTSTTYWITIERDGSNDWDDFYTVGVDEDASYALGALKVYDGSAWQDRPVSADLHFRVWGEESTTNQIDAIADISEFVRAISIHDASGVNTNQYRDGENSLKREIIDLLDIGTSSDKRLICEILPGRVFQVYADPGSAIPAVKWRSDGVLVDRFGHPIEPGVLVWGKWMEIEEVPPAADSLAPFSPRYITASEYDVNTGRLLPILGERNPFDLGVVKA